MKPIINFLNSNIDTIFSFEDVVKALDLKDLSPNETLSISKLVIEHNDTVLARQKNKINSEERNIKEMSRQITIKPKEIIKPIINEDNKEHMVFEPSIVSYGELILQSDDLEVIYELIENETNKDTYYPLILLYLYQELTLIKMASNNELQIRLVNDKIKAIKEHLTLSKIVTEKEDIPSANYDIILYRSMAGNIAIKSDLESIDPTYYEQFNVLLNSIKDGSLLNYRGFVSHSLKGVKEVKYDKCRIAFIVIDGKCIILNAFVKKTQREMACYSELIPRTISCRGRIRNIIKEFDKEREENDLNDIMNEIDKRKRMVL